MTSGKHYLWQCLRWRGYPVPVFNGHWICREAWQSNLFGLSNVCPHQACNLSSTRSKLLVTFLLEIESEVLQCSEIPVVSKETRMQTLEWNKNHTWHQTCQSLGSVIWARALALSALERIKTRVHLQGYIKVHSWVELNALQKLSQIHTSYNMYSKEKYGLL